MNIGIVTTWFERGAAYVSKAYLDTLSTKYNVFVYARGGEKYATGDPAWDRSFVTWGKVTDLLIQNYIEWDDFKKWIERKQINILIFNEQNSWDVILKCQKLDLLLGAYIDYYTHETVPFFKLYDFLLCNTKKHFGVFKWHPQAFYIPWGTNLDICQPTNNRPDEKTVHFFHSAGMGKGGENPRKGTDILVKAFKNIVGYAKLTIHSQVGLNEYSSIEQIIQNDPRIEFVEGTYPLPGLYCLGDVYVYPTRLEGIGLSIPEALACGLPVITTDASPMNEFVINDFNGKLVRVEKFTPREDNYYWEQSICAEVSLTEAMQYYVDNKSIIRQHGMNARLFAEENLDWKKNSSNFVFQIANLRISRDATFLLRKEVRLFENRRISLAFIILAKKQWEDKRYRYCIPLLIKAIQLNPKMVTPRKLLNYVVGELRKIKFGIIKGA